MSKEKIERLERSIDLSNMNKLKKLEFFRNYYNISQAQLCAEIGHSSGNYLNLIVTGGRPLTDTMYERLMGAIHDLAFKK